MSNKKPNHDGFLRKQRPFASSILEEYRQELSYGLLNDGLKLWEGIDRSGKQYSWMIDCREVLLKGNYLHYAGRLLWERLRPYNPSMVGGMAVSAIPLTIAILYEAWMDKYPLSAFIIRQDPKTSGLGRQIEGPVIQPGTRIVIIDDIVNSGKTLKKGLELLEPYNPLVVAIGVLINFEASEANWLSTQNLPLEFIYTLAELGIAFRLPSGYTNGTLHWFQEGLNNPIYDIPNSGPAIADDIIVMGNNDGFLLALTLDGKEHWRFSVHNRKPEGFFSPLIHKGKIFVGSRDGNIYCLNSVKGTMIWRSECGQSVSSTPAIDTEGNLIFISNEVAEGGAVLALKSETGELLWELKTSHDKFTPPYFDPERAQVIVGASNSFIYAIDAVTGKKRWQFRTYGEIKGRATIDKTGICFVGSFDGFLYALEAESGQLKWKKKLAQHLQTNPLIYQDLVIIGGDSAHVFALEQLTGLIRWVTRTDSADRILSGVAQVKENLLAVGSSNGCIYLLNGDSGSLIWKYQTGGVIRITPVVGSEFFLVPADDGNLYAFSC